MKTKIILPVLMFLGLTFGAVASKAQSTSALSNSSPATELSTAPNNLTASNVETKTTVTENSSVTKKQQKATRPSKKDWEDRSLAGKILLITGGVIFVALCVMYGTVSVG